MGKVSWGRETIAGLAGAIGSVPDGMAMAVLAGANPMAGLYASFSGPTVGGLTQSTAVMVVATTSAAAVTAAQIPNSADDFARTLATVTVLTGVFIVVATLLGIARLLRFVSASVMSGFLFGVGLILVFGQLADAAGVSAHGDSVAAKTWDTLRQVSAFEPASLLTAGSALVIAVAFGRGKTAALAPLLAIVVPSILVRLTDAHVATVASSTGAIDAGLPPLVLPDPGAIDPTLVSTAIALTVVILVQAAGLATAYPNEDGSPNDTRRDFLSNGIANAATGLVGGIPVGGSVGQTALNVLAGGRTRWSVVLSGIWMLVFVVALGPLLSDVPIPALAGLLILAGVQALRPRELVRSWHTSRSSGLAALVTLVATLFIPVHLAVLLGVLLSLILVGIDSAGAVRVVALEREGPNRWRRVDPPRTVVEGSVLVIDVEGSMTFVSAARVGRLLPIPPDPHTDPADGDPMRFAVVLRLRSYLRPNVTMTAALDRYGSSLDSAGGRLFVCGLRQDNVDRLRDTDLLTAVTLVPEGDEVGRSLEAAHAEATSWTADPAN